MVLSFIIFTFCQLILNIIALCLIFTSSSQILELKRRLATLTNSHEKLIASHERLNSCHNNLVDFCCDNMLFFYCLYDDEVRHVKKK